MSIVSISMPEELVTRLDEFADDHGYSGRSEVVRQSARNLLSEFENEQEENEELASVVIALFDYGLSHVEQQLMQLRHEHNNLVVSNDHCHTNGPYCMELFVLDGSMEDISTFIRKVRAVSDIDSVDHLLVSPDKIPPITAESEHPLVG
ncbi:CopG family ribbon-helix-helix protein [Halococcus hamelinensis]|uniref:Putative nickel-responsive regulator n=1 Tax=Halococcus hamelinensis 100A6 TaxID=1132509 RepID=M0MBU2_9EURY|nr:CopG family ribbon-helix-helix protein [Halococcus hamelinensis]EMA42104.1 CopG family transcripitonal regulator [Halococcus hamelinensis 100A6]